MAASRATAVKVSRKKPAKATTAPAVRKRPAACATDWAKLGQIGEAIWGVYFHGCQFPAWSYESLGRGELEEHAKSVVLYYQTGASLKEVKKLATQREPANIAMNRCYDEDGLEELFGYRRGAYAEGGEDRLLPNIAVYCLTPMRSARGEQVNVHVINVVGYAFDSDEQPDYRYFFPLHSQPAKWEELVQCMQQMWRYVFECARRKGLRRVFLADVGGGAFSGGKMGLERYARTSYVALKEASLPPVQQEYESDIEVHTLPRVPDFCFSEEGRPLLEDSLLVNAWDPWSMVGNGNKADNSLDGFFGRCTAMAVLCWPKTNPHIKWETVGPRVTR
eukprot:gb/GFBE01002743.1/.p1 GENE.gb/GFBE01002743.1/~~gb/GFBE01002743.1/.p1  ORF type:complete len:334 (+),score=57.50 gb/GFBE01002743.1/:1-1002(+)